MFKLILSAMFMLCIYGPRQAQAAELDSSNLIGQYKVQADLGFQKYYLNFHVINTQEFEVQRTYPSGQADEVCNGRFRMNSQLLWTFTALGIGHVFKGTASCPSNRSKQVDFNIDFKNKTTEDLINGTTVAITTSLAPGYVINSYFKRK